jgi:two-component system response regulator DegU
MTLARLKCRVVIVDDHTLFREGLRTILEMEDGIEVVADAESAEDIVELVWQTRPDVLLLDIRMPQGSGLDAVPAVLRISPGTQVLVLTACDEKEEHVRAENGLTERELEIVRLVASGYKNKEVGSQLTISERTVKTHLTNIFQKLGVRDRVGLVMYALRHGLTRAA